MKKIQKTSELLWVLGIVFVALGVAICSKANLGVSMIAAPAFVVSEAVEALLPWMSVGVMEYLIQGVLLIVMCIVVRRLNWRYLLAFAVAVIYGYCLDLFVWIFRDVTFDAVWLRWVMMLVGDCCTAFGVACFFRTYLPLQVYELFVAEIASCFRIAIHKVKRVFDISLLVVSVVLALALFCDIGTFDWSKVLYQSFHSIGMGTLVTTLINAPIINFMGKLLDRITDPTPCFPKLEKILKRD